MTLTIFILSLLATIAIGIPIAYALILCGVALMLQLSFFDGQIIAQNILNAADSFPLIAIPLFMVAGEVMNAGGLSRRIINLALALMGHVRGGLGFVTIAAATLLSSLSGSALADAAALSALLIPLMVSAGHTKERAGGLIASASIIAPIIPPSIGFIIFGIASGLSITKLFLAGIAPGLYIAIALCIAWWFIARKEHSQLLPRASSKQRLIALRDSFWALMLPVIVIVGLRFGVFTPTEAGAVAAVYSIFVSMVIYREMTWVHLSEVLLSAGKTTAAVMFLVAAAAVPSWMITVANIPGQVIDLIAPFMDSPKLLMAVLMLLIIIVGTALDLTPTILLLAPILVPVVKAAGIDPIYFGVLFMINCAIGLITPPVGTVLNVVSGVAKLDYEKLLRGIVPFLIAELAVLVLLILIPELVTVPAAWLTR